MLTRKCDICGKEMRMTTPRYKVIFDGWLYTEKKDICADCFKRIKEEIKQADTPQKKDEIVLDPSFAELSDEQFVKAMKLIEPQTDCGWGKPTTVGPDSDKED